MALSAWKQAPGGGTAWSLRVNPSSGNLHPTEAYVILPPSLHHITADGVGAVMHYAPETHALERRLQFAGTHWAQVLPTSSSSSSAFASSSSSSSPSLSPSSPSASPSASASATSIETKECGSGSDVSGGQFLVALSSIYWREMWKYGLRGFRYCQHDVGHAIAGLRLAASLLGWRIRVVDGVNDVELDAWLGLDRATEFHADEREWAELLLLVDTTPTPTAGSCSLFVSSSAVAHLLSDATSTFLGKPNVLSGRGGHVRWPEVDAVHAVTRHTRPTPTPTPTTGERKESVATATATAAPISPHLSTPTKTPSPSPSPSPQAATIIRQRRSAQDYDEETHISKEHFFRMLSRAMPQTGADGRVRAPWDTVADVWPVSIHLFFTVHRVSGLKTGLYVLVRDAAQVSELRSRVHSKYTWSMVPDCPVELPFYLLTHGDARAVAQRISCDQDIAGQGAFALAMVARFHPELDSNPPAYRRLFWETGMIGQVLYLEAESVGLRATGIGCFFDNPSMSLFFDDLKETRWQDLYHFTMGGAVDDTRLRTLTAYGVPIPPPLKRPR